VTKTTAPHSNVQKPPAISVRGVGKCHQVYGRPQDRLKQAISLGRRRYFRELWALSGVSFDVAKGESIGIVGRNGCGKSTLLQIITQTLRPTTGSVEVRGRVAALLELGSGFNYEFSGRDNVYMNASILGLTQAQIRDRFDAIVAFADIGDCLDRPVKTYSSGMVLRLAFAVQVQVEPDVLIVDEALAVGDEAFQRKCFARLRAFQEQGGTILFVSHSSSAVIELCNRAILLDQGEMLLSGRPKDVVEGYHRLLYAPPDLHREVREQIKASAEPQKTPGGRRIVTADVAEEFGDEAETPAVETMPAVGAALPARCAPEGDVAAAYFNPDMKPTTTVAYDRLGAEILDPHVTTLDGQRVNTLVQSDEYLYQYRVRFTESAFCVRFGNALKTMMGTVLSAMAQPLTGIPHVPAGSEVRVAFRFRCLMTPDVYFMNAGVVGMVDGREIYLHRIIDALMIRVHDYPGRAGHGHVNLYSDAQYDFLSAVSEKAA
jgi:lipopolysaccharide transport system ATP-binding protein